MGKESSVWRGMELNTEEGWKNIEGNSKTQVTDRKKGKTEEPSGDGGRKCRKRWEEDEIEGYNSVQVT